MITHWMSGRRQGTRIASNAPSRIAFVYSFTSRSIATSRTGGVFEVAASSRSVRPPSSTWFSQKTSPMDCSSRIFLASEIVEVKIVPSPQGPTTSARVRRHSGSEPTTRTEGKSIHASPALSEYCQWPHPRNPVIAVVSLGAVRYAHHRGRANVMQHSVRYPPTPRRHGKAEPERCCCARHTAPVDSPSGN